jgi:hypothetical protein
LTLYLQTPYKHIRDLTGKLLNQALSSSFMFAHDPEEVQLWLDALPLNHASSASNLAMSNKQQSVLQFLDNCITRFNKAQYKYTDQLVNFVNITNSGLVAELFDDTHYLPVLVSNGSSYKHPFSPLLLTLCENLDFIKDYEKKKAAVSYLTTLLPLLLTKQKIPFYLQDLCIKLVTEEDLDVRTSPRDYPYTPKDMVHQAKLCLGNSTHRLSDIPLDTSEEEEKWVAFIQSKCKKKRRQSYSTY